MFTIDAYRAIWKELDNMWIDVTSHTIERDMETLDQVAKDLNIQKIDRKDNDFRTVHQMIIPSQQIVNKMSLTRAACKMEIIKRIEKLEPLFG
jgi:hypothetical protein